MAAKLRSDTTVRVWDVAIGDAGGAHWCGDLGELAPGRDVVGVGVLRQHGACVERVDGGGGCDAGAAHWWGDLGELVDAVGIRVVRHYGCVCGKRR